MKSSVKRGLRPLSPPWPTVYTEEPFFLLILKLDSSLVQYSSPQFPSLHSPKFLSTSLLPGSLPFCFPLEKSRPPRDNNQTGQNRIQWDKAKALLLRLDTVTNRRKRGPRADKRVRDTSPSLLRFSQNHQTNRHSNNTVNGKQSWPGSSCHSSLLFVSLVLRWSLNICHQIWLYV